MVCADSVAVFLFYSIEKKEVVFGKSGINKKCKASLWAGI